MSFGHKHKSAGPRPCADCPTVIDGHPRKMRCAPCAKTRAAATQKAWRESPEGSVIAKAYRRKWYRENRASQKARHAAWLKTPRGRECVKAQYHRFHAAHPDAHKIYSARNYAKNGAKWAAKRKQQIRENPVFWRAYFKKRYLLNKARTRGAQMPAPGEAFNARLHENELFAKVIAAIPRGFDEDTRMEVASRAMLAVLECGSTDDVPAKVKAAIRDHNRENNRFRTVSIDAPVRAGSTFTIGDTLSYEAGQGFGA